VARKLGRFDELSAACKSKQAFVDATKALDREWDRLNAKKDDVGVVQNRKKARLLAPFT
jgi:hypothetical protein